MTKSLDLNTTQSQQYEAIKVRNQAIAAQITDSLHYAQDLLVDYMQGTERNEDSIQQFEESVQRFQKMLLHKSIEQYYEVKSVLRKEQIPVLDSIYRHILVCRPACKFEMQHTNSHIHTNK